MKKTSTKIILIIILLAMISGLGYAYYSYKEQKRIEYEMWLNETEPRYLANDRPELTIADEEGNEIPVFRGTEVQYKINKVVDEEHPEKKEIVMNDILYYVDESYLVNNRNQCVTEKEMFTEKPEEVFKNTGMLEIAYSINKNVPVEVIGFEGLNEDGTVDIYKIKTETVKDIFTVMNIILIMNMLNVHWMEAVMRNMRMRMAGRPRTFLTTLSMSGKAVTW